MKKLTEEQKKTCTGGWTASCRSCGWYVTSLSKTFLVTIGYFHEIYNSGHNANSVKYNWL